MLDWLDSVAGPNYASAVLWTLAALLGLVLLLLIVKLLRNLTAGTYVAGGRNRKTRLAVMDATAVDSHRRLVLVRRDDVEHLLLIGGSADIVVERDIRLAGPRRQAAPADVVQHSQPVPAPEPIGSVQRPRPPQPVPSARNAAPAPRPAAPAVREPAARPVAAGRAQTYQSAPAQHPSRSVDEAIDDTLLQELEMSLDEPPATKPVKPAPSLDDEMTRLLGELVTPKR